MPVSASFKAFVLEQLSAVAPVSARAMFGGVGIYAEGLFFALMDDDRLYFKVDDASRSRYQTAGMGPFDPYKDGSAIMGGYYELPGDVLEDEDRLPEWMREALTVAAGAKKPKKRAKR
ncbi:MAG TPA: TfoX/Sxy family protein [Holophagaceae bacterium]|jgi:DNA transformation protein|nr:TfoX/Sxy family protein [Holophagaceae bacterium]